MRRHADKVLDAPAGVNTPARRRPEAAAQLAGKRGESLVQLQQIANNSSRFDGARGFRQISQGGAINRTGLPDTLKKGIENLSGQALDGVKVHYNSSRPAQLNAHAYSQGTDIHLAPGQEKHLPHEAWHVVQQMQGRVKPTMQLKGGTAINDDAGLEREADIMGSRAQGASHARSPVQLRAGPHATRVVQRVVLTKIVGQWEMADGFYKIDDVLIGGRTPSPFSGTMGAHSTAWVAHVDAIRRHLVGTNLGQGIDWFTALAQDDLASPLLKLDGYLNTTQKSNLATAQFHLLKHLNELGLYKGKITSGNYAKVLMWLRSAINAYLTFVNFLPLSTVAGGDPKGHGEGTARSELNVFEYGFALRHEKTMGLPGSTADLGILSEQDLAESELKGLDTKLRQSLLGTMRQDKVAAYRKAVRKTLINMFASETPDAYASMSGDLQKDEVKQEIWALALQNFLRTIRLAYPYAYDFAEMADKEVLLSVIGGLNAGLNAAAVYDYLSGQKKFEAIAGTYTFHSGDSLQDFINKHHVESALSGKHKLGASKLRSSAKGLSDRQQGGSGFGVTVMVDSQTDSIGDVLMNGRTRSPFSATMGAHTTAWTVHVDAVVRLLKGHSLTEGIRALANQARAEMMHNKAIKYAGHISEKHQIFLVEALNYLKSRIAEAIDAIGTHDEGKKTAALEALIHDYMTFVNFIPMSTIEIAMPNGRTEGMRRAFLNKYEEHGDAIFVKGETKDQRTQIIRDHLLGMFDPKGLDHFPPDLGEREPTDINKHAGGGYDEQHPLYKHISKPVVVNAKRTISYENFLHTIEAAYPNAAEAVDLAGHLKGKWPNIETTSDKHAKLMNKKAHVIGNPADPLACLYKGYQVEIRAVNRGKATVMVLADPNQPKITVDVISLAMDK
ncbi:eCIS core domain-containing protein [Massilia endophytica]|uniref:eCIS core domain-containing protein n=1 Tax=Massilia endophytica TaxID=2899220 RepID=UPI001E5F6BB5|nr:DUF4157 domain-containing protein [Massilia endophytica]UGQ47779.1 DUF4157 domain-containing protein [Massilia endophytica]